MKTLYTLLSTLLIYTSISAQEIPVDIIERVNAVDYIFEGKVINSEPYYSNNGQYIHTSNTVNITKRLKGNIQCGTIEIITHGGTIASNTLTISHTLTLTEGSRGIFLCKDTDSPVSVIDFYPETNPEVLEATYENQSFIRYWWDGQGINAADLWNNYDSLALVYNATEAITGLTYIDCGSTTSIITHGTSDPNIDEYPFVFPVYPLLDVDSMLIVSSEEYHRSTADNQDRANDKIFYSMENLIISGTTTKYLEFDVMVKDDWGLGYLDLVGVRIQYDPLTFGNSVVSNSTIAVTRGSMISDINCYSNPTLYQTSNNIVTIKINASINSSCRAQMLTTKQSILHVKIEIIDCNPTTQIALVDTADFFGPSEVLTYSAYTNGPSLSIRTYYDHIEHVQSSTVPECVTTITGFYPKEIAGGVGDILSIKGFQFGPVRGDGNIFFKNADDAGMSEVYLDDLDFIYWSDTLVQLKMPSYDSAFVGGTASIGYPAGTGVIKLFTDDGGQDITTTLLKVKYSHVNRPYDNISKIPFAFAPPDTLSNTFIFRCDTAVANYDNGKMKLVIDKALRDWSCLTGINWSLGPDIIDLDTNLALENNICVIKFLELDSGKLAITQNWLSTCNGKGYQNETDIVINNQFEWFNDTTGALATGGEKYFYSTILHELGHAHLLKHVINPTAVMHYKAPVGVGNIDLSSDFSCDEGGNWIMSHTIDTDNAFQCAGYYNMIQLPNSCSHLGFSESIFNEHNIRIYPNPAFHDITLELFSEGYKEIEIKIIDIHGKILIDQNQSINAGTNNLGINVENLPVGIYIFNVISTDNEINISTKMIKSEH